MNVNYETLKLILEGLNFEPLISNISSSNQLEAIKIPFYEINRNKESQLILTLFSPKEVSALYQEDANFTLLNIFYFFPEIFDDKTLNQAKLLANRINAVALLPGFGIEDNSKKVYFRYSIPIVDLESKKNGLKTLLDLIINTINIYSEPFILISEGKSYSAFLQEMLTEFVADIEASL